jgi:dTDP-4-amino-4,6-dideoxygalactose transaminase
VAAVLGAGFEPIFVDIDPDSGIVIGSEWERARIAGASVALVVHLYGNPVEMWLVRAHFPVGQCLVVDDAAQAFGASNSEGIVGRQGDVGLLSFGQTKHIDAGGAMLLFADSAFADGVAECLHCIPPVPDSARQMHIERFRKGLDAARAQLRVDGANGALAFHGLLDGHFASLQMGAPSNDDEALIVALDGYAYHRQERKVKSEAWSVGLMGLGFQPVGMGHGSVPWRYTCRLPGIDWETQNYLGNTMRSNGIDVSHWYLPTHWMCGHAVGSLPGTERLAQEIFQFWLDKKTSIETIKRSSELISGIIRSSKHLQDQ